MSIIATKGYYRTVQVLSILVVPVIVLVMVFGTIDDRIIVNGVVESTNHIVLRSPLDNTQIESILVEPGQDVTKGQALMTFRDLNNWKLELAKTHLEISRLRILCDKIKDVQLPKALDQMNTKREKADTYEKLNKQGAQAALTAKELRTEANSLEKDAEALKKDISLTEKEIALMQKNAEGLEQQLERLTLRAPFNGRVTDILVKELMSVNVGKDLLALSAMDEKIIRCFVPENRASLIQEGQNVAIKSNLYNYLRYTVYRGKVKKYYHYGTRAPDGTRVLDGNPATPAPEMPTPAFETFIALEPNSDADAKDAGKPREELKIGSTATCEIIVERQPIYQLFLKN